MAVSDVKIKLDEAGIGMIEVDGIRLEEHVTAVDIRTRAGQPSEVVLHIPAFALGLEMSAEVRTLIEETRPKSRGLAEIVDELSELFLPPDESPGLAERVCEVCGEPAAVLVADAIDGSSLRSEFFDPDERHSKHYFCAEHERPFRLYSLDRSSYVEDGVAHQVAEEESGDGQG